MHRDLERVHKACVEIISETAEKRCALMEEIKKAQDELNAAEEEQAKAENMAGYDTATEKVKRAELAVQFAEKALKKLDEAPQMQEEEYMKELNICRAIMDKAVEQYRTKAASLMEELRRITEEYKQTAKDTNHTLIVLDSAANLLQTKNKNKNKRLKNDKDWERYALRYNLGTACALATECKAEEKTQAHFAHDSVLCAAWNAVDRAYPRQVF